MAQTAEAAGSDERPQLPFLLIPKHLQERLPQHRHAVSEPESKFSLEYQEQKSPAVEEMELRVKRAWIGVGVSGGAAVVGMALTFVALGQGFSADPDPYPGWVDPVLATGLAVSFAGACGMISSAALVGVRKRKLRRLQEAHYGTPRRVQWDLAHSRLVF